MAALTRQAKSQSLAEIDVREDGGARANSQIGQGASGRESESTMRIPLNLNVLLPGGGEMAKRIVCWSLIALTTCGCAVVQTYPLSEGGQPDKQASGTYFLAKQVLVLDVTTTGKATTIKLDTKAVPDTTAQMQVGFELSPLADDTIKVDYENGLLSKITATAVDRTGDVIKAIAKDIGAFREGPPVHTTHPHKVLEFDPFDDLQASRINKRLGPGNCVEVEIYPNHWSSGCGRYSLGTSSVEYASIPSPTYTTPPVPAHPGIYYRRALAHRVHVVVDGKTVQVINLLFANDGPVLRVDIDRTAFVTRETTIMFDKGELTSVSVKKDSEALAVAKLPADIVDAYVSGVTNALTNRQHIDEAQTNLINAQANEINAKAALEKAQAANPGVRTASPREGNASSFPTAADCQAAAREQLPVPPQCAQ
jgi:hypothetical protein